MQYWKTEKGARLFKCNYVNLRADIKKHSALAAGGAGRRIWILMHRANLRFQIGDLRFKIVQAFIFEKCIETIRLLRQDAKMQIKNIITGVRAGDIS